MLPTSIYREHSTATRHQPCTKQQTKYVLTRARQPKQADRVGESYHIQLAAKRAKKSKSARRVYTATHNSAEAGVMREGQFSSLSNLDKIRAGPSDSRNISASNFCVMVEHDFKNQFGRVVLHDNTKKRRVDLF